jgi:hypothetical protein
MYDISVPSTIIKFDTFTHDDFGPDKFANFTELLLILNLYVHQDTLES